MKKRISKKIKIIIIGGIIGIGLSIIAVLLYQTDLGSYLQTALMPQDYSLVSNDRMKIMKERGCVYDGLLTPRYNAYFNASVEMLERSDCHYIHRAIETWNISPNFPEIKRRMTVVKNKAHKEFIYGMFLAESINITKTYYDPYSKRRFYYSKMCAPGTYNAWGENTCKPSLSKKEYRDYLKAVTRRAIDLGIEDFTFGQIYYQDAGWKKDSRLIRGVIADIKKYARSKGEEVSVGAQTNTIDNEEYLRSFDYITGGIGQDTKGRIEKNNSCWSYYYNRDGYCWALLWSDKYKKIANNILVYLDWNNSSTDDIHRFTRMHRNDRTRFLAEAYDFFEWHNIGFLMPLGMVLGNVPAGCYGPTREFYSASYRYGCKDEGAINQVFRGEDILPNHSRFISQEVPTQMIAGREYTVSVFMQNTSYKTWEKDRNIALGSFNPKDNLIWGINRVGLEEDDSFGHNATKEFNFKVIAPKKPGKYKFQWRMVQEGKGWFGQPSELVEVEIIKQ